MSHNDRHEAEKMLQKAMEMTVKNGVIVKLYEIGEDQPDEHFPRNHVRIEIGIGGGGTCTSQIAKVRLEDEAGLTP